MGTRRNPTSRRFPGRGQRATRSESEPAHGSGSAKPPPDGADQPPEASDQAPVHASPEGLRYLFEVTKSEVDTQFQIAERIDSKAKALFTITVAIFGAAQALALRQDVLHRLGSSRDEIVTISIVAGALTALALLATAFALWVRRDSSVEAAPLFGWLNDLDNGAQSGREVSFRIVEAYITLLEERREANKDRARELVLVQILCVVAIGASILQLVAAVGGLS
jgi:hypothetical protein